MMTLAPYSGVILSLHIPIGGMVNQNQPFSKRSAIYSFIRIASICPVYGHGPRICLGRIFAELQMQVFIVKLIRSYKLGYHYEPLKYNSCTSRIRELKFKMTKRS
ncbi:probable cytochrome P450 301a1, mitochondrial [Adelges cooleyi]|uniref:probable cytochrome P450 301a1, mitochondrial n=1 Tax=Adelges cooleyi TaxID=133065 RepID=UPI00217F2840|nr:probable cytochrome P450 301a1, mitochondrial [Adelges cooleyi]